MKSRLEPKGEAVGFISLYPTGDLAETNYVNWGALKKRRSRLRQNWAVPSCQDPKDGCLLMDGTPAIGVAPMLKTMQFQLGVK
jgi:hypothetical protein